MAIVMNCTENIQVKNVLQEQVTFGTGQAPVPASESPTYQYASGTSTAGTVANVIDLHCDFGAVGGNAITLAASAHQDFTLSGLTDAIGRTVAFVRLRKWNLVITSKTDGDYLTVQSTGATHALVTFVNGSYEVWGNDLKTFPDTVGLAIVSGTTDTVRVVNQGANPITFELALSGCST